MRDSLDTIAPELAQTLLDGGVAVLRTDTIYGIVACAENQDAVEKVYRLKDRDSKKSPIVLIADSAQMFDDVSIELQNKLDSVWPGKVSVVLSSTKAPNWISRDNHSVAYRLPNEPQLIKLLEVTGPLIAPSANPESMQPAVSVERAKEYFGNEVDIYLDGGVVEDNKPSQLISMDEFGNTEVLR